MSWSLLAALCCAIAQTPPTWPDRPPRGPGCGFRNPFPLHAAAERGDIAAMQRWLVRFPGVEMPDTPDAEGKTPLHAAALAGQTNAVAWLLDRGAKMDIFAAAALGDAARVESFLKGNPGLIEGPGPDKITPLHWATPSMARLLIERGADVNARSASDFTPLHDAARRGRTEVVRLLLEHGADVNAENRAKATPLSLAAERGHEEIADALLARRARLDAFSAAALGRLADLERCLQVEPHLLRSNDVRNGGTLLHWAAMQGRTPVVRKLLELDAAVNARDRAGMEPLQLAIRGAHREAVDLLLEAGADVNSRGGPTPSCLHLAVEAGNSTLVELLLKHGAQVDARAPAGTTPLHAAASRANVAIAELLLSHGADIDARTGFGSSPLHSAAQEGPPAMARMLLDRGADPNLMNERMQTPLQSALRRQRWETAMAFVESGVVLRRPDGRPCSMLVLAIQSDAPRDFIQRLLERKGRVHESDPLGRGPLQQAAMNGRTDLIDLLLGNGADINSRDDEMGRTALHWAAEGGQTRMVEALLQRSAETSRTDREGKTPLHLAAKSGRAQIVQLLLAKGANVNARTYSFDPTPLSLAVEARHEDVANILRAHGGRESLTVVRILLGCVLISAVLAIAHRLWQWWGHRPPSGAQETA